MRYAGIIVGLYFISVLLQAQVHPLQGQANNIMPVPVHALTGNIFIQSNFPQHLNPALLSMSGYNSPPVLEKMEEFYSHEFNVYNKETDLYSGTLGLISEMKLEEAKVPGSRSFGYKAITISRDQEILIW